MKIGWDPLQIDGKTIPLSFACKQSICKSADESECFRMSKLVWSFTGEMNESENCKQNEIWMSIGEVECSEGKITSSNRIQGKSGVATSIHWKIKIFQNVFWSVYWMYLITATLLCLRTNIWFILVRVIQNLKHFFLCILGKVRQKMKFWANALRSASNNPTFRTSWKSMKTLIRTYIGQVFVKLETHKWRLALICWSL